MRKRKKQIIALLCALALCGGSDIMRVWADVSEEIMPAAAEEEMLETTEETMPAAAEEEMPETTEEVMPETTEEMTPETTEDAVEEVMPEATEEVTPDVTEEVMPETAESKGEVPENPAVIVENDSISLRDGSEAGISMFALRNISFQDCFGDQLEGLAKEIYDAMVDAYVTQGKTVDIEVAFSTPVTFDAEVSGNSIVANDAYNEAYAEIQAALGGAYEGLMKDYPQVFWIESLRTEYRISAESSVESASGWKGTIAGCTLKPEEFNEKYSEKISEFNDSVTTAKAAVRAKLSNGSSDYDTLKAIHDYLCEELEYNHDALSGGSAYQYAHNVYTAFAGNKKVVCEGYAKAFKILCDEFGIPCILATGEGVTSNGTEAHMWNCVKMENGKWYAVDVTWDDQNIIYYNYFLAGKNTVGFNGNTFSEEHISDTGFVYPEIADGKYVQCDHEWETVEEETAATCTTAGSKTTKTVCKKCQSVKSGSEKTETIEKLGHDYEETITKAATCMEAGSKTNTCTRCGDTVTETIPKMEHSYGEWTVIEAATCTESGGRKRVCQVGGETQVEVIEALGHDYEETITKEATCTEEGSKTKTCTRCDDTVTEAIPKVPHTYGEWEVIKEATCTETGEREHVCEVCEESETEAVEALGHDYEETITKEATCTEEGSKRKICTRCDDTVTEAIPKVPHTNDKWILRQAATSAGNSVMERRCVVCGEIQTEEIAADGTPVSGELIAYHIIEGANSTWKDGSSVGIRIRVDGEFEKFQSVWIDGVFISSGDYTAETGSTIINLKTSYLEKLSKGTHLITVLYEDGYAGTAFSVIESETAAGTSPSGNKADNNTTIQNTAISRPEGINEQTTAPKTGDTVSLWLYAVILFAGFACVKMFWDKYVDEKYGDEM